ncbi:hypothetical protein ZWY2020_014031 [Hordeum vulgare]|nr:hypothetical protein ZWY2020_014031 [Hordeum vulgare]
MSKKGAKKAAAGGELSCFLQPHLQTITDTSRDVSGNKRASGEALPKNAYAAFSGFEKSLKALEEEIGEDVLDLNENLTISL